MFSKDSHGQKKNRLWMCWSHVQLTCSKRVECDVDWSAIGFKLENRLHHVPSGAAQLFAETVKVFEIGAIECVANDFDVQLVEILLRQTVLKVGCQWSIDLEWQWVFWRWTHRWEKKNKKYVANMNMCRRINTANQWNTNASTLIIFFQHHHM